MPPASASAHLDEVFAVLDDRAIHAESVVSASWKRSAANFNVDPASAHPPRVLTAYEVSEYRQRIGAFIAAAQSEMDHLYRIVSRAGYVVLLCDENGVAIDHRGPEAEARRFAYWGVWLGGIWSEEAEGTNGIGTCIAERRPVTIHQGQHFRSRHISLSCSDAPIFGGRDELLGVLNISSIDPVLSESSHALAGALVIDSARAIQERYFREQHRRDWIVALSSPDAHSGPKLLAVDKDHRIVGADYHAHDLLLSPAGSSDRHLDFWNLFERDERIFPSAGSADDLHARLFLLGSSEAVAACVTPPENAAAPWRSSLGSHLHAAPRRHFVAPAPKVLTSVPARGGLPPKALRRVQDYIDTHLGENIDLETLANVAGLSLHYFARAFKQATGVPPHGYILGRRLDKARELLIRSDRSLADIALETGFSDQSHLARHFRQSVGISPGTFRRSHR